MIRALGICLLMATGAQAQTGGADALADYMGSTCQEEFAKASVGFDSYITSRTGYTGFRDDIQIAGYDMDSSHWDQLWSHDADAQLARLPVEQYAWSVSAAMTYAITVDYQLALFRNDGSGETFAEVLRNWASLTDCIEIPEHSPDTLIKNVAQNFYTYLDFEKDLSPEDFASADGRVLAVYEATYLTETGFPWPVASQFLRSDYVRWYESNKVTYERDINRICGAEYARVQKTFPISDDSRFGEAFFKFDGDRIRDTRTSVWVLLTAASVGVALEVNAQLQEDQLPSASDIEKLNDVVALIECIEPDTFRAPEVVKAFLAEDAFRECGHLLVEPLAAGLQSEHATFDDGKLVRENLAEFGTWAISHANIPECGA